MYDDAALIKRVVDVDYIKDFTMQVEFNDGKTKVIDFYPLLKGKQFEPLKERNNFIQFGLTDYTLEWYNGAEFSPEYLYAV
ncbi:MAG: DUF2442 domain-containing protein [Prevotellaceae bacterium]|jgi:hypothetical protein|nr:DUF2442 domain-containing protein [Prevotellaceae bacterium]